MIIFDFLTGQLKIVDYQPPSSATTGFVDFDIRKDDDVTLDAGTRTEGTNSVIDFQNRV
jgi:hypothetical protein